MWRAMTWCVSTAPQQRGHGGCVFSALPLDNSRIRLSTRNKRRTMILWSCDASNKLKLILIKTYPRQTEGSRTRSYIFTPRYRALFSSLPWWPPIPTSLSSVLSQPVHSAGSTVRFAEVLHCQHGSGELFSSVFPSNTVHPTNVNR
jgi:hypothetical protein